MASVLALVSKGEFERDHARARAGDVLPYALYASTNKALDSLADGGDLYLVTVRPGEVLWLVAVLRAPRTSKAGWVAPTNVTPVADASPLVPQLRFQSGKGVSTEPGKLAMSLQTPRTLTAGDVALLDALVAGGAAPAARATASPTSAATQSEPATTIGNAVVAPTPKTPKPATTIGNTVVAVGTPWATAPERPASVPPDAAYDAIDERWVQGVRLADGTREGPWKEWRKDGSLYVETHYTGGLIDGTQREYYPDGSLSNEARWVRGVQKDSIRLRPRSGPVDPFWASADARVVQVDSVPDEQGLGWRTGILRDADGVEVTPRGEPVPPRPAGVPSTARLAVEDGPPAWVDVTSQYTTLRPVGLKRVWSLAGELLRECEYTPRGRLVWSREALDPDPRVALVDAFFADPITFSPSYQLGQQWTPARHAEVRARLRTATTRHVAAYLEVLTKRVEWHLKELAPDGVTACGFEVAADWLARGTAADEDGAAEIHRWLLTRRIELHDRASVREQLAAARVVLDAKREADRELLREATALADGETDQALDALERAFATDRATRTEDELLSLARRALRRPGLTVLLGDPTRGELLLRDETRRVFVFDGVTFAPAPLVVDTSDRSNAVHFQHVDTCDERRLFVTGEHVWWSFARFGWMVHLQGSRYFADRGQGEVILSALVRCPDRSWVDRVTAMYHATLPRTAKEVDPFFHEKQGWLFVREYDANGKETHGRSLSRGVDGAVIVSGSRSPGVLRLEMREKKQGAGPKPVSEHASREEAIERFSRFEAELFRNGYELERVVALPVREKVVKPKAPPPVLAVRPAVTLDVAERVEAELRRAASEPALSAKLAALCDAWQRRPVVAIAKAIDTLASSAPTRPDVAGKTKAAIACWDELEATRDPAVLGPLLASLADVQSTLVQSRLERLTEWPPDPRLDRALAELAWAIPFTSSGTQSVWRRIFARLAASQDARVLAWLRPMPAHFKKKWKTVTGAWAVEQVEKILVARTATLEALDALTLAPPDEALLAEVLASASRVPVQVPTTGPDALLAAIFAAPGDASLRLAYAAQVQDVRAEHIMLSAQQSLDKAGRARLATLERDHAAELAGPLAKYLKKGARFRGGFLVEAEKTGADLPPELAVSPWWSTVEDLDVSVDNGLLRSPALTSLRALRGARFTSPSYPYGVPLDAMPVHPAVTHLSSSVYDMATLGEVLRSGKFPALSDLQVALGRSVRADVAWLDEPAARQLTRITIVQRLEGSYVELDPRGFSRTVYDRTGVTWLAALWAKAAASCPALAEIAGQLEYGGSNVAYLLTRAEAGGVLSVKSAARLHGWSAVLADNLQFLFEALAPHGFRSARLDFDRSNADAVAAIEEAARLAGIAVEWRAKSKR